MKTASVFRKTSLLLKVNINETLYFFFMIAWRGWPHYLSPEQMMTRVTDVNTNNSDVHEHSSPMTAALHKHTVCVVSAKLHFKVQW